MNATKSLSLVTALAGGVLLLALTERGGADPRVATQPQAQPDGITVVGVGRADAVADRLELRASLTTEAPVASDAYEQFVEGRRRALDGLAKVELDGLAVRGLGATPAYSQGQDLNDAMMGGFIINGQPMEANPKVRYREQFVLTVSGIDSMDHAARAQVTSLLLDAAVDSGLELQSEGGAANVYMFGMQQPTAPASLGLISFTLTDPASVERAAYAAALDQAKRRAQTLAELAGIQLGGVRSIEVLSTTESWNTATANNVCEAQLRVRFGQP